MKAKLKRCGNSFHIRFRKSDGYREGDILEIITKEEKDNLMEEMRRIAKEEIQVARRGEY